MWPCALTMVTLWASVQCIWPTYQHVVTAVILFVTVFTILTSKHNTGVCICIYVCLLCVHVCCVCLCVYTYVILLHIQVALSILQCNISCVYNTYNVILYITFIWEVPLTPSQANAPALTTCSLLHDHWGYCSGKQSYNNKMESWKSSALNWKPKKPLWSKEKRI